MTAGEAEGAVFTVACCKRPADPKGKPVRRGLIRGVLVCPICDYAHESSGNGSSIPNERQVVDVPRTVNQITMFPNPKDKS